MNKKVSVSTLVFFVILFSVLTFLCTAVFTTQITNNEYNKLLAEKEAFAKLSAIDDIAKEVYYYDIDDEKVEEYIIQGYLAAITDGFSQYLNPEQAAQYLNSDKGEAVGIGIYAYYDQDTDSILVSGVMENSPADKAGIITGDIITKVESIDVSEETYFEAINAVTGEENTEVHITIKRWPDYEETLELTLTRKKVNYKTVQYEMLDQNIAYIKISEFNSNTDEEFNEILDRALADGAQKFMFDVRNNLGGDLDTIVAVLDRLLPEGPIVRVVGPDGVEKQVFKSDAKCLDKPMTVLINRNTASAAELFCSALRDYKVADLVGENTFGKGCMQSVIPLNDGSLLIITTNLFNPPYGDNFHGEGVKPGTEIIFSDEMMAKFNKLTREEDTQFQAAYDIIKNK